MLSLDKQNTFSSDLRICHYALEHFRYTCKAVIGDLNWRDISSCNRTIQQIIREFSVSQQEVDDILNKANTRLLSPTYFQWLKDNPRATFWAWGLIVIYSKQHQYALLNGKQEFVLSLPNNDDVYYNIAYCIERASLQYFDIFKNLNTNNHTERVNAFIGFFDVMFIGWNDPKQASSTLIDVLKKGWETTQIEQKPLKWLCEDEDEEKLLWAWKTLLDKRPIIGFSVLPLELLALLTPTNVKERALALQAIIDIWPNGNDKKLALLHLNKAWNQQKLRKSRTDKKALNVYLKNETKARLGQLAENNSMRIGDFLEKLINDEYELMNMK